MPERPTGPRQEEFETLRPDTLGAKEANEWLTLSDQVLWSRTEPLCCEQNAALTAAVERQPQSPAAPAYRLWIADNLVRDRRFDEALAAYDATVDSAQSASPLVESFEPIPGALFHKAQAAALQGDITTALATYRDLAQVIPDDPGPIFHSGELADEHGDASNAADLYGRVARPSPSTRADDHAELSRRALLRLETPPADFAPYPEAIVDLLEGALTRRDGSRLRGLASRTHFAVGAVGGHTAFETDDMLDQLCSDLGTSSVEVRRRLLGSGDKRYLETRGWGGRWFQGDVMFAITRAPRGWQWTGVGITAANDLWLEKWRPPVKQENQPLPFPLLAPWPADRSFTAGGLTDYLLVHLGGILAQLASSRSPCGYGPRGFYYNTWPTHDDSNAFAIDFTRYRRYIPNYPESGGTPVLAALGGLVTRVRAFYPSGYSGDPNVVHIEHPDPANPSGGGRYTSRYLHMEGPYDIPVSEGMQVVTGTRLGRMDDTGDSLLDHLHFSIHDKQILWSGRPWGGSVRPTPMNGVRLEDGDSGTCVRSTNIEYPSNKPMIEPTSFAGQNWLITPAATAAGATAPTRVQDQTWQLVLSGVAIVDLKGVTASAWRRETVRILPELTGPLQYAIGRYHIPTPTGADGYNYTTHFQVEQWAPFAALSSVFNQNLSVDSGFAVDVWRPNPFETRPDTLSSATLGNLFSGIRVDVAVRDSDAWIHRLSYHITLLGRIVFSPIIIT